MTTVQDQQRPADAMADRRNAHREELAALLALDSTAMPDSARLTDDLALDSLAMMSLLTWLETRGIVLGDGLAHLTVGELLTHLERRASYPRLSVRVVGDRAVDGPADFGPAPTGPPTRSPLVPVLENEIMRLTPISGGDVGFLYTLATQPETCFRWRYRGAPPTLDRFTEELTAQVLVQYVARQISDNEPIGHVVAYGGDPVHGHAYVGATFTPRITGTGHAARAVVLFVQYLFHTFPLRKLYLEVPGFNWPLLKSGKGHFFEVEGVLRRHDYYAGEFWDKYLCAIYPQQERK